jgi:hypothetical protein
LPGSIKADARGFAKYKLDLLEIQELSEKKWQWTLLYIMPFGRFQQISETWNWTGYIGFCSMLMVLIYNDNNVPNTNDKRKFLSL